MLSMLHLIMMASKRWGEHSPRLQHRGYQEDFTQTFLISSTLTFSASTDQTITKSYCRNLSWPLQSCKVSEGLLTGAGAFFRVSGREDGVLHTRRLLFMRFPCELFEDTNIYANIDR